MDKFVLKTWSSRRLPYFVDILSKVEDIFLLNCSEVFFLSNIRFMGIFESHKSKGVNFVTVVVLVWLVKRNISVSVDTGVLFRVYRNLKSIFIY